MMQVKRKWYFAAQTSILALTRNNPYYLANIIKINQGIKIRIYIPSLAYVRVKWYYFASTNIEVYVRKVLSYTCTVCLQIKDCI